MKSRYKRAIVVFETLLLIVVGIGVFCRIYFGGISTAVKNQENPDELHLLLGETFSVRDIIEKVQYKPLWVKGSDVSVDVKLLDGKDATGILDTDVAQGRFCANGVGCGRITLIYNRDPKISLNVDFKIDFRSQNTADWMAAQLKDGLLPQEEIHAVKRVEISDSGRVDVQDLVYFSSLETVVLSAVGSLTELENSSAISDSVDFLVPENQYQSYLIDDSWTEFSSRIFPNGGTDKNVVVLHLEGGTLPNVPQEKPFVFECVDSGNPVHFGDYHISKEGYVFKGWGISNDGGKTSISIETNDYKVNGNVKAYAIWEENSYVVDYNMNVAAPYVSSGISSETLKYTQEGHITSKKPQKEGYAFLGWSTSPDSSTPMYTGGEAFSKLTNQPGATVTLYAVWSANEYTISYYGTSTTNYEHIEKVLFDKTVEIRQASGTRKGYAFVGWATSPTSDVVVYRKGDSVKNLVSADNGNISLYAVWQPIKYQIVFYSNVGETNVPVAIRNIEYNQKVTIPNQEPKKKGHTFLGWSLSISDMLTSMDELPTSGIKAGQIVEKLTEENGAQIFMYPVWRADKFTIKFNANGGSGSISNKRVVYGESFTISEYSNITRANHTFLGWNISASANTGEYSVYKLLSSDVNELYELAGGANKEITLYAIWAANYTISYNANGGKTTPSSQNATVNSSITLASEIRKDGYEFLGWKLGSKIYSAGEKVTNLTTSAGSTVTLVAEWKPITYTVSYDLNGGDGSIASVSSKYDVGITLAAAPARAGYEFKGWSYGGNTYSAGSSVSKLTTQAGGAVVMKAIWVAK